jgi:hypothetical protein
MQNTYKSHIWLSHAIFVVDVETARWRQKKKKKTKKNKKKRIMQNMIK